MKITLHITNIVSSMNTKFILIFLFTGFLYAYSNTSANKMKYNEALSKKIEDFFNENKNNDSIGVLNIIP